MSAPQSIIYVCSGVKLDNRYLHTYYWETAAAQLSFFQSKVVRTFPGNTYLRKRWDIKVEAAFEDAREWDYLYFTNGGKYWFYFINDVEYISQSTVRLQLELDVMQSYALDYSMLPAYVERQHVEDDAIGKHTIDEGLEIGELQCQGISHVSLADLCVLVQATFDPMLTTEDNTTKVLYGKYNGIYSGLGIYAVDMSNLTAWGTKLVQLDEWGKSDGIINMWMFPKALVQLADDDGWGNGNVTHRVVGIEPFFADRARPSTFNGYKPRNNKLFTYPYTLLHITNNAGSSADFRWELFSDPNECKFKVTGSLGADGGVRLYPMNYNAEPNAYEHGVTLANFPSCAWNQDVYKLWLAQNQNQLNTTIGMSLVTGAVGIGAALATGGGILAAAGGSAAISATQTIQNQIAMVRDKSVEPPQAKGRASSSINITAGFQTFTLKAMVLSQERVKILDDFFSMYGYKIQRVQTPNRCARENFTFVKTVGGAVAGSFCDRDRVQIGEILDKGITFWRNPANIGNYSVSNNTL